MASRIVFLGSKPIGYKCLQHLITVAHELSADIVGVRTQTRKEFAGDNNLARLAQEHGIAVLESLQDIPECDIIYSVQHHELLKQVHIDRAQTIAVNLHMAPLPEYRGCNQFSFAILDNAKEFGVTLHQMDTRIDHGDILFERRFAIPDHCWVSDLYALAEQEAYTLFVNSLPALISGNYTKVSQQTLLQQRGSTIHYRHEINELKRLDLNESEDTLARTIRATYMPGFEPPYFLINGRKVYVSLEDAQ